VEAAVGATADVGTTVEGAAVSATLRVADGVAVGGSVGDVGAHPLALSKTEPALNAATLRNRRRVILRIVFSSIVSVTLPRSIHYTLIHSK
jgi:hypothetical protein